VGGLWLVNDRYVLGAGQTGGCSLRVANYGELNRGAYILLLCVNHAARTRLSNKSSHRCCRSCCCV
jgi:hypothetical protein